MEPADALILVVDDDPTARRMLDVRMRALGCRVAMAGTGREALAAIEHAPPAVVLLDLHMPDLDGLDVLRTLRRKGIGIATIVVSARGSRETVAEAMNLGAVDFLVKPFDPQHLESVVRGVLERPPASVGES